jgi:hypothetical protein
MVAATIDQGCLWTRNPQAMWTYESPIRQPNRTKPSAASLDPAQLSHRDAPCHRISHDPLRLFANLYRILSSER